MIIWGVSLIGIERLGRKRSLVIIFAFSTSILSGYFDILFYLSRVLVFYPFYLVAYLYKNEIREVLRKCRLHYTKTISDRMIFMISAFIILWSVIFIFGGMEIEYTKQLGTKALPVYIFHAAVFWGLRAYGMNEKLISAVRKLG